MNKMWKKVNKVVNLKRIVWNYQVFCFNNPPYNLYEHNLINFV